MRWNYGTWKSSSTSPVQYVFSVAECVDFKHTSLSVHQLTNKTNSKIAVLASNGVCLINANNNSK